MTCPHQAVLIVTAEIEGTSSSVAKRRLELQCSLEEGHEGEHVDERTDERWQDNGKQRSHVVRHGGA